MRGRHSRHRSDDHRSRVIEHAPQIVGNIIFVLDHEDPRTAQERIGHLFCEMFLRLETVGLTNGSTCDVPPTQTDIAEATGLTPVRVNRTIQKLRRQRLVMLDRTKLTIPNMLALQAASLFNADYLHDRRINRHTDHRRNSLSRLEGTLG